jgi:predicted nucleic acid-binding protein
MNILLDTNILGRMLQVGHVQHQAAVDAVAALVARGDSPRLVPQVLYELWVVATRPVANNGLGLTAAEAGTELSRLQHLFPILPDSPAIFPEWEPLVLTYSVLGKPAHDAKLVAAMTVHGLTHLLTFNTGDFSRFPGIMVLDPSSLVTPGTP